ncbi:cytochrome P450 [Roseiflexus sp. RS-1]|uniref:cytochrome P450 n=1 Tax=Roseiflexus sp. (strain RS-1) TaxID=357808 RepID=UPI001E608E82|nr:cytochrome P450 [Roseiflexus sp. RS-1]
MTPTIVARLASPEFLADPYPVYRQLIEQTPVFWLPHANAPGGMWCIARYDDIAFVLREAPIFKDTSRIAPPDTLTPLDRAMLQRDPPDHTRLRRLASHAFTPRRVHDLMPRIEQISLDLIERIGARGEADFIADYARCRSSLSPNCSACHSRITNSSAHGRIRLWRGATRCLAVKKQPVNHTRRWRRWSIILRR